MDGLKCARAAGWPTRAFQNSKIGLGRTYSIPAGAGSSPGSENGSYSRNRMLVAPNWNNRDTAMDNLQQDIAAVKDVLQARISATESGLRG